MKVYCRWKEKDSDTEDKIGQLRIFGKAGLVLGSTCNVLGIDYHGEYICSC